MSDYLARLESLLDDLVNAAIEADMYERGYLAQTGSTDFYAYATFREVHRGQPGRNDMGDTDDTTNYETEVFGFWPGQIDQIFDVWKNIPDPDDFDDYDKLIALSRENVMEPKVKAPADLKSGEFPTFPDTTFGSDLRLVTERTDDLSGGWIESFFDNYVIPLPWVLANQQALVAILAAGVKTEAEIWKRVQEAVLDLAKAGATWFRSVKNDGPSALDTVVAVGGAINDGFKAVKGAISLNPYDVVGGIQDLVGAGKDLVGAIEDVPSPVTSGGAAASSANAYTRIAQVLEYTVCKQVAEEEQLLEDTLKAGVDAVTSSPGTFEMDNEKLLAVANGAKVLTREQYIQRSTVNRLVGAMRRLGQQVGATGEKIDTRGLPWLRPQGIGISAQGPYGALLALENAARDAFYDTSKNLVHVAGIVEIAAGYAYAADADAQAELRRVNDRLDRFNERQEALPDAPLPDAAEPYVIPGGEVYQDQDDCAPDDPFGQDPFGQRDQPLGPVLPQS